MAGVIDARGQWEHCNHCGKMVRIETLVSGYSPKWPDFPTVDLCLKCARKTEAEKMADVGLKPCGNGLYSD